MATHDFRAKCEITWVIDIFSLGCKTIGKYIQSPSATTMSNNSIIHWHLKFFPKGDDKKNEDYFSLFLYPSMDTEASGTIGLIDINGKRVQTFSFQMTMCTVEEGYGFSNFIDREYMLQYILKNDKITIFCEITLSDNKQMGEDEKLSSEEEKKWRLAEMDRYEILIDDDKFSDISLVSEGKEIKGHKCILAKSSPVFAAMFVSNMKEKQCSTVEIADIKYDILVEMMRFIYAGKVNDIDTLSGELAEAADKYAIDGLKNYCEMTMCKNLSNHNVFLCLELADRYRMDNLKKKGIEYVVAHANDITIQEKFKILPSILLSEICCAFMKKINMFICE